MTQDQINDFPDPRLAPESEDLIAVSARDEFGYPIFVKQDVDGIWPKMTAYGVNWSAPVLMTAYRCGLFPMPLQLHVGEQSSSTDTVGDGIGWWSPANRAIFVPDEIRIAKSLRKSMRKYRVTCNRAFVEVVAHCADPRRAHGWIDDQVQRAYENLHHLGLAHSIEVWCQSELVGGLYGVSVGGVFAGESMFHKATDASKVALVGLGRILMNQQDFGSQRIIDCQWKTPHLASLGAVSWSRNRYIEVLGQLASLPDAQFPSLESEITLDAN